MTTQFSHKELQVLSAQIPPELKGFNLTKKQVIGLVSDYILGHNLAVDNANLQDLTTFGENYITQPTTMTAMEVVSDSIEDDVGQTGATRVMIHGLGGDWKKKTQFVTMNGTTPVTVDESAADIEFLKINHMHVMTPSPTNAQHTAVGNILLRTAGGGTTYGNIEAGGNMELACRYTIPDGFKGYITSWTGSVGELPNTGDEIALFLRATIDPELRTLLTNVFIFQDIVHLTSNNAAIPLQPPHEMASRTEIKVSAKLNGGAGTALASASFQIWLVPDN